ncbi:MAG: exodeoxyribonuclease VII large subunit, partial [Saprospiraceae bacterium]|nr:exodeoxyribonuclease VII large subunit [Saprospiraceae bacterium]
MTSYSLYELNEYIKRVIALNFTETIWVNAEVGQVKEVRGQVYMDLVQHSEEENQITAQASAIIWYKSYLFIRKKLGELLPAILSEGSKILVKVKVEYHERYGMKLVVEDIDPSYTIGQMEIARQKIIENLRKTGNIEDNKQKELPEVIQKIAVISSATAAGFADFKQQLAKNEYGYDIQLDLYQAAMQGMNTEKEVCQALDQIGVLKGEYDCIAIIRGGGSRLDLASFDNFNIGFKIATSSLPVLTGIGHEIDSTVADIVAHSPLKTPTAVAAFVLDRNAQFESDITQAGIWISQLAKQNIENHNLRVEQLAQLVQLKPQEIIRNEYLKIEQLSALLKQGAKYNLRELKESVLHMEQIVKMADPQSILKRGYVMLKKEKGVISSIDEVQKGETVSLEFLDGVATATINKTTKIKST